MSGSAPYACPLEDYLLDGMRLAIGMGRKSALAGLWWGGGKGAIVQGADVQDIQRTCSKLVGHDWTFPE